MLNLLCCLVSSQQTFPRVSFEGQTLVNHSYVDLGGLGSSEGMQCHTDLETCCSGAQGPHRGDWYFPNETRLPLLGSAGLYEARGSQRVILHWRSGSSTPPNGVYCCKIPTVAVHYDTSNSLRERVYIGLYTGGGGEKTKSFTDGHLVFCRGHLKCETGYGY